MRNDPASEHGSLCPGATGPLSQTQRLDRWSQPCSRNMILPGARTAVDPGLPSQAKEVIGFAIGGVLLSGIIVVLRFYTRGVLLRVLGLEDYYLGLALVSRDPSFPRHGLMHGFPPRGSFSPSGIPLACAYVSSTRSTRISSALTWCRGEHGARQTDPVHFQRGEAALLQSKLILASVSIWG